MVMKIKSEQLRTEMYQYNLAAGENILMPIKARPGEVICVHSVCCYNPTEVNFTLLYKMLKVDGKFCRLNYAATLNAGVVKRFATDVYLKDGDECGFAVTPNAAGNLICVNFQILRFRDDEYNIST